MGAQQPYCKLWSQELRSFLSLATLIQRKAAEMPRTSCLESKGELQVSLMFTL